MGFSDYYVVRLEKICAWNGCEPRADVSPETKKV